MHNQRFEEAAVGGDVVVEGKTVVTTEGVGGDHCGCVGERDGVDWYWGGEREFQWSDVHGPGGRVGVEWIELVGMMDGADEYASEGDYV